MIVVAFTLHGLTALLVIIAWANRNYSPIRAKNLVPITCMLLAGVLTCIGGIASRGLVANVGVWSQCKVWTIWVKLSFMYVFQCLLVFRAFALYRIFIQNKPCCGYGYYGLVAVMVLVILAFGVPSQLVSDDKTVVYAENIQRCRQAMPFKYGSMAVSWLIWILYTVVLIRIHSIRSSFNELRESVSIYILGLINIVTSALLYTFGWRPDINQYVRIAGVALDALTTTGSIWILLVYPVCMCLFKREEYLVDWKRKLIDDGVVKKYEMQHRQVAAASNFSKRYSRLVDDSKYSTDKAAVAASPSINNSTAIDGASFAASRGFMHQPRPEPEQAHARFERDGSHEHRYAFKPQRHIV
ncbi:hypothetical protein GGI12_002650 [Dipsacomyces acuminosporus]|nr:hypothetical protein GGI12_002650 [Dipsacomyces acuminosporus]